jgi:hypothetical protein
MSKVINIHVEGGLVKGILNIPKGVTVTVCNFDRPNDETGETFTVAEYSHSVDESAA